MLLIFLYKLKSYLNRKFQVNSEKEGAVEIRKLIFHINDFGINGFENELVAANSCGRKHCTNQDNSLQIILSIIIIYQVRTFVMQSNVEIVANEWIEYDF